MNYYICIWCSTASFSMDHWFPINILKIKDKLGRYHQGLFFSFGLSFAWYGRQKTRVTCLLHDRTDRTDRTELAALKTNWRLTDKAHTQGCSW